jgi:poly(hydroxyalkanoate) depolymerase family esterase
MSPQFQELMRQATQLTRNGDLAAAQAAIQAALGHAPGQPGFAAPPAFTARTIDVVARVIDPRPDTRPQVPAAPRATPSLTPTATATPTATPSANPTKARTTTATASGMTAGTHSAAGLRCDYELFVPPATPGRPMPLVVMLHGCTQSPADFAAGTRMNELARAQGVIVLYPAQSRRMNPQGCWNWFKHSHQKRGHGEPELLASLTREVMQRHPVDPQRVYVAGLSAGGAMADVLGRCYPELYAAVGVHSGLAAGSAHDLPSALAAMNTGGSGPAAQPGKPVIVFHGDADATVHPRNAAAVVAGRSTTAAAVESVAPLRASQRRATRALHRGADGRIVAEHWTVHGAQHAWSGGAAAGSYTDPEGPDASAQMLRFFMEHPHPTPGA